uniref:CRK n=1 Tax=Arundo donax TaxID=35708 RepID=A0A0A9E6T2_ARUDO
MRREGQEGGAERRTRRRQGHPQSQDDDIHCYRGCPKGGKNFESFGRKQEFGPIL